jgi:uridine kinase
MQPRPFLIGIAGPSCAGKGAICHRVARQLKAPVLPLDSYYHALDHLDPAERAACNFDDPAALDEDLLVAHLESLVRGETIRRPVYDFARHTRAAHTIHFAPSEFVIVEGLFTLYWDRVRALLAASIFIHAPDEVCLGRRLARDQRERGRSADSVIRQYEATVRPMRHRYIEPSRAHAGLVLDGALPIAGNARLALDFIDAALAATATPRVSAARAS